MGINNVHVLKNDEESEKKERVPTQDEIKNANECPSCDAYGICPSHKWIHDLAKKVVKESLTERACPNIYHEHRDHEWGERARVYHCTGKIDATNT